MRLNNKVLLVCVALVVPLVSLADDAVEAFLEKAKQTDPKLYSVFFDYRSYLDTYCNHLITMDDLARFGASVYSLRLLNVVSETPDDDAAYMAALTAIPCPSAQPVEETPVVLQYDANAPLSELDGERLLFSFVSAYNNGDLLQLMSLFADNAEANGKAGLALIEKDYGQVFGDTEIRQLVVQNVRWDLKEHFGTGRGHYQVTLLGKGDQQPRYVEGSLDLTIVKHHQGLQITKINHHMNKDAAQR